MTQCPRTPPVLSRDPGTRTPLLTIRGTGSWAAFCGPDDSRIDFSRPIAHGREPGTYLLEEGPRDWSCFAVKQGEWIDIVAERHLTLEGGHNFRDLGGFPGHGGQPTRWGKLIRADDMGGLSSDDLAWLATIPVTTVVDFRTDREAAALPDALPLSVHEAVHLPIVPGRLGPGSLARERGDAVAAMRQIYRELVLDPAIQDRYRAFFALVASGRPGALLFHCSAGKDRTGFAAALILLALGVDRGVVIEDYLASNRYVAEKYADNINGNPQYAALFQVREEYLLESLSAIDAEFGGPERYLAEVLGVDTRILQGLYLA